MILSNKISACKAFPSCFRVCNGKAKIKTNIPLEGSSKFLNTDSSLNENRINFESKKKSEKFFKPEKVKKGFNIFVEECHKFYEEKKESYYMNLKEMQIRDPRHNIDLLHTFESEESLKNFVVTTDSSHDGGYSSAKLEVTQCGTLMFSGNLSTVVPKTGLVTKAGYANFTTLRKMKSFQRLGYYDWRYYTHLVLKLRGDGRTYLVIFSTPYEYDHTLGYQFSHPLYTRGGPYWQIVKMPFNHFIFGDKGRVLDDQTAKVPLNKISKFGFTIADNSDGPFKLEIDYIGLEKKPTHKLTSPYEQYSLSKNIAL